jgi:uncharacterized protein (UPF0264 family)
LFLRNLQQVSDLEFVVPQLLVSVRSAAEAVSALDGGCDILDVKEPSRGPLGMADMSTISAIIEQAHDVGTRVPISVALGDAVDWTPGQPVPQLPVGISYLKLGTAHLAGEGTTQFTTVQQRLSGSSAPADGFLPQWIAVGYADFPLANAPAPEDVAQLAMACGCTGLLIDTCSKQHRRLVDWLNEAQLVKLAERCRTLGLTLGLAGRLQAADLEHVLSARPQIVGIRSAACRAGDRNDSINAGALSEFRHALHAAANMASRAM